MALKELAGKYLLQEVKERLSYLGMGGKNVASVTTDGDRSCKNCVVGQILQEFTCTSSESLMPLNLILVNDLPRGTLLPTFSFQMKEVLNSVILTVVYIGRDLSNHHRFKFFWKTVGHKNDM